MASFACEGLDELVNEMRKLGQMQGPVVDEMLDAAAILSAMNGKSRQKFMATLTQAR